MSDEIVRDYLKRDQPRSTWGLLVNPFTRLAGTPGLVLGLLVVAATVAIGVVGKVHFDGIMDVHVGATGAPWLFACEALVDWLIVALLFLVAGLIWGSKPHSVVDYFGMSALGRFPFLLVGLVWSQQVLGPLVAQLGKVVLSGEAASPNALGQLPGMPLIIIGSLLTMAIMLWGLFLNFFALREASGMPTQRAIGAYIGVILVGEILSKIAIVAGVHMA